MINSTMNYQQLAQKNSSLSVNILLKSLVDSTVEIKNHENLQDFFLSKINQINEVLNSNLASIIEAKLHKGYRIVAVGNKLLEPSVVTLDIPITVNQKFWGHIVVESSELDLTWQKQAREFLEYIAVHIAIAIELNQLKKQANIS